MNQDVSRAGSGNISPYISDLEHYAKNSRNVALEIDNRAQVVVFVLGSEYLALQGENVKEIVNEEKIYFVPGVPETILGIVNIRGDIESVIDLGKILDLGTIAGKSVADKKILIARSGDYRCGIIVDRLVDVAEIPQNTIHPVEGALKSGFRDLVRSEFTMGKNTVLMLDMERIMEKVIL